MSQCDPECGERRLPCVSTKEGMNAIISSGLWLSQICTDGVFPELTAIAFNGQRRQGRC